MGGWVSGLGSRNAGFRGVEAVGLPRRLQKVTDAIAVHLRGRQKGVGEGEKIIGRCNINKEGKKIT